MRIDRNLLRSLVDEVILRYEDENLVKYMDDDTKRYTHNLLLGCFAVMFFRKNEERLHGNLQELLQFYAELGVPFPKAKVALAHFFRFYKKWIVKYGFVEKAYYERVQKIYQGVITRFDYAKGVERNEEEFLLYNDTHVDEAIDRMHYADEDKISAAEFFAQNPIDADETEDLILIKDRLEELRDQHETFDETLRNDLVHALSKLSTALGFVFSTPEFQDVGVALDRLVKVLMVLEIEDEGQREMAYAILMSFVEDLLKWIEMIFLEQSAVDIHYLDASLFANAVQFETFFAPQTVEAQAEAGSEEDDEFITF